jgi:tetratricopeptide (TPR) repeat protein
MSLLLNALKEADSRRDHPAPKVGRAGETATVADDAAALSILEDSAQVSRVHAPQPEVPKIDERLARRTAMREAPAASRPPSRRLVMPALLALTAAILAGTYIWMRSQESIPPLLTTTLPASQPAVVQAPPAPAAAATTGPELEFTAPEPRMDTASALAPRSPEPEPLVVLPNQQAAPEALRVERSKTSPDSSPLQQAYEALRAGDLARAEALYEQALREESHLVDAHLGLAALAEAKGNKAAAVAHYKHVLELVPDHSRAWSGLANLAGTDATPAIESRLRNLIAARPEASLHFSLGNALARQSRWAEAQESYFNALAASPDNADYAFNLAVALDHLGKREIAGRHYDMAIKLSGNGAPVKFEPAAASRRLAALRETTP